MKKLYLFFLMLFALIGATSFAQDEVSITISMENGKWVQWNSNESNPWARTWNSISDPTLSICCKQGGNSTTDIRGNTFYGANNMSVWGDARTDLMFFTNYGTYEVMVEAGWYLTSVEFDFDCANNNNQVDGSLSVTLGDNEAVTSETMGDTQHVSWTNDDEDVYAVQFIVTRIAGTYNFARTSNFVVKAKKLGEAKTALAELSAALEKYEGYQFLAGNEPGNYGVAEVAAFNATIAEAHESEDNPDLSDLGDEELAAFYRSLIAKIEATYNAVVASRNTTYNLADGYYRIKTALNYYTQETVIDEETQEERTVTTYHDKYMTSFLYGETFYSAWETPENECDALWHVSNKDGYYDIVNMATDARFNNVGRSAPLTMSLTSTNLIALDPVGTYEGVTYANLRVASQESAADNGQYIHQNGHNSGRGTEGNLVGWYTSASYNPNGETPFVVGGSEWIFEPVDAAVAEQIIADYGPVKDQTLMKERYKIMLADAKEKMEIARDIQTNIDATPLITSADQLSSPYTESSEGSIEELLDNNTSTYWHSDWTGGTATAAGIHYLQIQINEAGVSTVAAVFTRRPVSGNHVTEFGVFGTNNSDAAKDECEELATLSTPYGTNTETITTTPFDTKGYKFIRFYVNANSSGGYIMHMSEFQLYKAEVIDSETTQAKVMGDVFANLEKVINDQENLELDDLTATEYNALKTAYDAFLAVFVDPTALRQTLAELKNVTDVIVIGDQPGFWASGDAAGGFKTLYDNAKAYDAAGAYTADKTQEYIDALNKQNNDIFASANQIKTDKWYRIRFANEEEFAKYDWDTVAGDGQFNKDLNVFTSQPLFNKYITVSRVTSEVNTYTNEDGNEVSVSVYSTEEQPEASTMGLGNYLVLDDKEDIAASEELDQFRFIAVGDSAFIMQNKGTNLFLKAAGTSGSVTLSAHPSLFNVRAIGYGENVISSKSITGANQNYLHGQVLANLLVTWDAYTPGSRSGLYLEEAGDVAADYQGTEFNMPVVYGALNAYCYPVEISVNEGQMWGVNSVDIEANSVSLAKIEKAVAGRPFLYVNGSTEEYVGGEEADMISFNHGYAIDALEPQTNGVLKGTYESTVIDRGDIYAKENNLIVNPIEKDAIMVTLTRVPANSAYITEDSKFDPKAEVTILWTEEADGIEQALANVSKSGAIYTIDGKLVSKSGNLNDAARLGKGIYILNGTKIVVK